MRFALLILITILFSLPLLSRDEETLTVPSGVYKWGNSEFYIPSFQIKNSVRISKSPDEGIGCELPLPREWLAAASLKKFRFSDTYEMLTPPGMDECYQSEEEVEAEGVTGRIYFGGKGKRPPQDQIVHGGSDKTDLIISVHSTGFYFWGDEYRPDLIGYRCLIIRDEFQKTTMYVNASSLNLRKGRGTNFPSYGLIARGDAVEVLHKDGDWYYVRAKIRSSDCGYDKNGSYHEMGWVSSEYLLPNQPGQKK